MDDKRLNSQTGINGDGNVGGNESSTQMIKAEAGSTVRNIIQAVVSRQVTGDVQISDKVYTHPGLEELNDYLAQAVANYEVRMSQALRPAAPPDQPYKFLYAFEIEDADVFFGRDAASEALYQTILKDRLTVLHARSGAGKTSLLNAGLSPRLIREGRLPVYARAYDDPVLAIKRAIAIPWLGPWPELLPKLTLHEFLGLTCAHLSRQTQELVVILDQFEEFFVFWPERDHRQPFIDDLADCYGDEALTVRIIIALRKDYYSDLADFQGRIPTILHNEYRLDTMTRDEAQAAITGPTAKLGQPVAYEQALLDTLLDDLARGGMEPPHLQIICTRLYEALTEGEMTITLTSYEKLGRAEGVLGGYFNSVLDRLPDRGGSIAREVLKELVSSEATKRVLSYDSLVARVEAEGNELDGVLAHLVNDRLLRRDEVKGEIFYEMAHEYLVEKIKKWIELADLEFKQAEELLMREVANWRVHNTLIPRDRLEFLHAQGERLRGLDDETWECILRSALQADFAVEDWSKLASEVSEKLSLAALDESPETVRRAATRSLGTIWGLPEISRLGDENREVRLAAAKALERLGDLRAVEPLMAALRDEDSDVRRTAAGALGRIGNPRAVEPLMAALRDWDRSVRWTAAGALGRIGDPRAVESLIAALRDEDSDMRRAAAEALGRIGEPAMEPLIAALQYRNVCWAAAEALGEIGEPAVEPLMAALQYEDSDVRRAAGEALVKIGEPAVKRLIAALREQDRSVRWTAAGALGRIGDPRAVEPLIAALRDWDRSVRRAATYSLGVIWRLPEVSRLGEKDRVVRRTAAEALGQIGDRRSVELLIIYALRDEDSDVRRTAAEALGEIGEPAVEPLIAAFQYEHRSVRRAAAEALVKIGEPAVEPLMAALRYEDSDVRRTAAVALGRIGHPRAVEPLIAALRDWDRSVRWTAAGALRRIGDPRAVKPLIAALRDEDSDVCWVSAEALGRIGDPRAVEPLIAALQCKYRSVRRAAAEALVKIGEPAVKPLIAASRDKDVQWEAVRALKKIGTPEALAALE